MIEEKGKDPSNNLLMINGPLLVHSFTFCLFAAIMTWARFTGGGPEMFRSENGQWPICLWSALCWPSRKYPVATRIPAYSATAVMFANLFFKDSLFIRTSLYGLAMALIIIGAFLCHRMPDDSESLG